MTSKHTPGPWQWSDAFTDHNNQPVWTLIGTGDGLYGILTCDQGSAPQDLNDEANVRLIATAPELLEALKGLDEAYCRAGDSLSREERAEDRKRLVAARTAIAKATGAA